MGTVKLTYHRYGQIYERVFQTVNEAAQSAIRDEEHGEIFATQIEKDGAIIWTSDSPDEHSETLEALIGQY